MGIIYKKLDVAQLTKDNTVFVTITRFAKLFNLPKDKTFIVPSGEMVKSLYYAKKLCNFLIKKNITRQGAIVAIGGGTVGDLSGFVASVYLRGIDLILVPTTLLAQIDSSIGGKTAINYKGIKNIIGSFYPAKQIIVDFSLLHTLNNKELINGYGELVKYTLLNQEIDQLYKYDEYFNAPLIQKCIEYKDLIVSSDYYDHSLRRNLSLGHTIGHAIEKCYNIPHGRAVLYGLYYELMISSYLGYLNSTDLAWARKRILDISPIPKLHNIKNLVSLMQYDKKNNFDSINFVLFIGNFSTKEISLSYEEVTKILQCL
ncbi:MAG: 3-dehydroquinate synthase family protein [Clostridia bacterium]